MRFYLIIALLTYSCSTTKNENLNMVSYDKIYSFTSHPKAGSTSSISYQLNSGSYELKKVEVEPKSVEIINSLLKDLKGIKHRQRKIPSVSQAYEMWEGKDKEIFIL